MIDPEDLLEFASGLVRDQNAGEVGSRRAISSSCYALFHTMTRAGAALIDASPQQRSRIARAFDHRALADACREADRPGSPVDARLVEVAGSFRRLREAREKADYALDADLDWDEANTCTLDAVVACGLFGEVRDLPETTDLLFDALFQNRLRRG